MTQLPSTRILCAWFPAWPIVRRRRSGDAPGEGLFATIRSERARRILTALSPEAIEAGLRPDMALAQARAIVPDLVIADDDPDADRESLAALADWAERYTPLATPDTTHGPAEGLLLDITGCAHLFGGEAGLVADLQARLGRSGIPARIAIAGTAGAAWALARAPQAPVLLPAGQEAKALADLPTGLLRLPEPLVAALHRLGLRRIGALARLPRADLAARFGALPGLRLDQALGHTAEPIAWPRAPAAWEERLPFAEPIGTADDLTRALETLAASLCTRLEAARLGGTAYTATFLRVDGIRPRIELRLAAPARDAARLARLLAAKLDTVDPGFGIDAAILAADTAPLTLSQPSLADSTPVTPLATTLDELTQTLTLWRAAPAGSHVPERSTTRIPPLAPAPHWTPDPGTDAPIRLFARPEPIDATAPIPDEPPLLFRWRGALHRIRAASGPSRIAAEWWQSPPHPTRPEPDRLRDYYRVEDTLGARFWVFRTGLAGVTRWFVHGVFG